jgi:outer membrane murein-binding lipoprotein Lpp
MNAVKIGLTAALLGATLLAGCAGPSSSGLVPSSTQSVKKNVQAYGGATPESVYGGSTSE